MVQLNPEDRFTVEEYLRIYKGNALQGGGRREWLGETHQCTSWGNEQPGMATYSLLTWTPGYEDGRPKPELCINPSS